MAKRKKSEDMIAEIRAAHAMEFNTYDKREEEMRNAIKEVRKFVDMMKEEGFTTQEALIYLGSMTRPQ